MIAPKLETLSQLFKGDFQFLVPDYQRPYSWKGDEVGELIEDISACVGKPHGLYLGTIILDVGDKDPKKVEIVDGQQRITSIFLLLMACRDHATEIGHKDRAQATQQKITFTDDIENKTIGMKLIASSSIRPIFEHMADSSWDGTFAAHLSRLSIRRVKPVYDHFRKQLKSLNATQLGSLQAAIYATQVIRIDITGKDEAFAIFERTNARGMDLEVADLLKNFLHQQQIKTIKEDWKMIVDNASSSMLRMLKFFYIAHRGAVQKAELYKKLRQFSDELKDKELFLARLLIFSEFYNYVATVGTNPEVTKEYFHERAFTNISTHQDRFSELHLSLQALKYFKVVQCQPVIFSALLCIERLGLKTSSAAAKTLVRLVSAIERFHFINTHICSHITNEVEALYANACTQLLTATDFSKAVEEIVASLKKKLAPYSEFEGNFVQVEYSATNQAKVAYIFDRFNNLGRKIGERKLIFYPDSTMFRRHYNVEHIAPQTPAITPGVAAKKVISKSDNIGNLTVVSVQLNSELGNKTVQDKFKIMTGKAKSRVAEFPEVVEMIRRYGSPTEEKPFEWDDATISQRAVDLAKTAYAQVWQL